MPVLASFRPTWRQALCRWLGAGVGIAVALGLAALLIVGPPHAGRLDAWLATLVPLPLGALGGLAVGRRTGVRLDMLGLHQLPVAVDGFTSWLHVADVRAERRHGRTVIAVYRTDGSIRRLRAPYDGRLLARDPQFERKLFTIAHVWGNHRTCRSRG